MARKCAASGLLLILLLGLNGCASTPPPPLAEEPYPSQRSRGWSTERSTPAPDAASEKGHTATSETAPENRALDPEPPPLSGQAMTKALFRQLPAHLSPIYRRNGDYIQALVDLDKNGREDLIVPIGERTGSGNLLFSEISDPAILYSGAPKQRRFYLVILYQTGGELILRYQIDLGREILFQGFQRRQIRTGEDFPYCLSTQFRTKTGIRDKWIILNGSGISEFQIKTNLNTLSRVEDLDGNGYLDIIVHNFAFEDGQGYETFLTWYRWDGRSFSAYRRTNVVRNLNEFFDDLSRSLQTGGIGSAVEKMLCPQLYQKLKAEGLTDEAIFLKLIKPLDPEHFRRIMTESGNNGKPLEAIESVVFPVMMENPFSYEEQVPQPVTVPMRIETANYGILMFNTLLNLHSNPFTPPEFCFSPW